MAEHLEPANVVMSPMSKVAYALKPENEGRGSRDKRMVRQGKACSSHPVAFQIPVTFKAELRKQCRAYCVLSS